MIPSMIVPAVMVLGVGLLAVGHSGLRVRRATASRHWLYTTGRVINSAVDIQSIFAGRAISSSWFPKVEYEYSVNGVDFRGDTVSFGQSYSNDEVTTLVNEYRVGQSVAVYYDPSDAGRSVLIPGRSSWLIELACDVLLVIVGSWFVLVAIG